MLKNFRDSIELRVKTLEALTETHKSSLLPKLIAADSFAVYQLLHQDTETLEGMEYLVAMLSEDNKFSVVFDDYAHIFVVDPFGGNVSEEEFLEVLEMVQARQEYYDRHTLLIEVHFQSPEFQEYMQQGRDITNVLATLAERTK